MIQYFWCNFFLVDSLSLCSSARRQSRRRRFISIRDSGVNEATVSNIKPARPLRENSPAERSDLLPVTCTLTSNPAFLLRGLGGARGPAVPALTAGSGAWMCPGGRAGAYRSRVVVTCRWRPCPCPTSRTGSFLVCTQSLRAAMKQGRCLQLHESHRSRVLVSS